MIKVAMIFAAGRGERMRPLTDVTPKPLLAVARKPLIVWQIEALARAGIEQIVINHAWLGEQIPAYLGDGRQYGVQLHYSAETQALETAGGIAQALPLIRQHSSNPIFLAVSGDVFTDYDYTRLHVKAAQMTHHANPQMHLVMVPNPEFHPQGDFILCGEQLYLEMPAVQNEPAVSLTFGNIGLYDVREFESIVAGEKVAMGPLYQKSIAHGFATGELFTGVWENVGTPAQLEQLNLQLGAIEAETNQ